MKIIHELTLDVSRQGCQASVPLTQHDAGIHSLLIRLRNGSKEIKLNGSLTATLFLSNDTSEPMTVYTENGAYPNCLECLVSPYMTSQFGELSAQLQIFEGTDRIFGSPEFMFAIREDTASGSGVASSTPFAAVVLAEAGAAASAARAEEAAEGAERAVSEAIDVRVVPNFANVIVGNEKEWDGRAVAFDDVSPIEHKVSVTSNGYGISSVVSCGKNILPVNSVDISVSNTTNILKEPVTGTFTLSYVFNLTGYNTNEAGVMRITLSGESDRYTTLSVSNVTLKDVTITGIYFANYIDAKGGSLDNIQLEVGTKKTAFEPYKEGESLEVAPNAPVEFRSISPNMTLYINGDVGDQHEIRYNKDTNKVIEKLTQAIISTGGIV